MSASSASSDDSYSYSYSDGSDSDAPDLPQIEFLFDDSGTMRKNHMTTLPPDVFADCKKFYKKYTGKRTERVTRLTFGLWFVKQVAKNAVKRDWDGILNIHSLATEEIVRIPDDGNFDANLDDFIRRMLTEKRKGSSATDDFRHIVGEFLEQSSPTYVFFITDGALDDMDEFFEAYNELAPQIVKHAGNDHDFGVAVLITHDNAARQMKAFERFDFGLSPEELFSDKQDMKQFYKNSRKKPGSTIDLFGVADLMKLRPKVKKLIHMAAHE
jgi:hypothetical protein